MKQYNNFLMKNVSWVKIGGITPLYLELENRDEVRNFFKQKKKANESFDILGWGANTLISESGIEIPVVRIKAQDIEILSEKFDVSDKQENHAIRDNAQSDTVKTGYSTDDLYYDYTGCEDVFVRVDAGVPLPILINFLIKNNLGGLEVFAKIPGTVGAGIYNNIHGAETLFDKFVYSVECIDETGEVLELKHNECNFAYNKSIFQEKNLAIVSAILHFKSINGDIPKQISLNWAKRKANQPQNSLGSVFSNLNAEDKIRLELPTASTAYVIEHLLKLSGYRVGGIMIPEASEPGDPNWINKNIFMNMGNGTADDFLEVIAKVCLEAREQLDLVLHPEIFFKGFDKSELKLVNK